MNSTGHSVRPAAHTTRVRAWARRLLYAGLALPMTATTLVSAAIGQGARAARWERRLAALSGLTGLDDGGRGRTSTRALVAHASATLGPALLAFALAYLVALVLVINLGYPARPGFDRWDRTHLFSASANVGDSWGGPTLAGAWAVHAAIALSVAGASSWPLRRLADLRARSVMRRLGR